MEPLRTILKPDGCGGRRYHPQRARRRGRLARRGFPGRYLGDSEQLRRHFAAGLGGDRHEALPGLRLGLPPHPREQPARRPLQLLSLVGEIQSGPSQEAGPHAWLCPVSIGRREQPIALYATYREGQAEVLISSARSPVAARTSRQRIAMGIEGEQGQRLPRGCGTCRRALLELPGRLILGLALFPLLTHKSQDRFALRTLRRIPRSRT